MQLLMVPTTQRHLKPSMNHADAVQTHRTLRGGVNPEVAGHGASHGQHVVLQGRWGGRAADDRELQNGRGKQQ